MDLPPSPGQTANPQWCPLIEAGFQVRPDEVTMADNGQRLANNGLTMRMKANNGLTMAIKANNG